MKPSTKALRLQAMIDYNRKKRCEREHLFFSRVFFKVRQNTKFKVNWHHQYISDVVQDVIDGKLKNVVINVSPGSSKTELVIINFIARGLALNPMARFLHLSYSDDLALLNSQTARDMVQSEEYQEMWPLKIADDTKSKKRWNVVWKGKKAGGVYATSLAGQVTGFRAGHMEKGFQGAILIDDPLKPDDAFSKAKLDDANNKLLNTVASRKADPETPIILIMQRVAENDPTGFIKKGNLGIDWKHVVIPALIDETYVSTLDAKYQEKIERKGSDRFSYWPDKERIEHLLEMEKGSSVDKAGSRMSRHVFTSQYQQNPVQIGGNLIKGEYFDRYTVLPEIKYRHIYADTAQKTAERNDFSVFQVWGMGVDYKIYLLDQIRGKWEGPDLKKQATDFWNKHKALNGVPKLGHLRRMKVEDKSSGTDLIQSIRRLNQIPIDAIQRNKDKLTRVMDATPYMEQKCAVIPENAPWVSDFITECEAFTADDSHAHDDQIDPMLDAIADLLSSANEQKVWGILGKA